MIRRILDKIWDSFQPHPELFEDSADTPFMAAMTLDGAQASIIAAAEVKDERVFDSDGVVRRSGCPSTEDNART